jgi:hypothetical protein
MCQEVDPRGGGFDKRSRAGGFDKRSRAVSLFFPDGTVVMDYSTLVVVAAVVVAAVVVVVAAAVVVATVVVVAICVLSQAFWPKRF